MLRELVASLVHDAWLKTGFSSSPPPIEVTPAARPEFGDFASNIAMIASKTLDMPPRKIAEDLAKHVDPSSFERIDVAGPGFLNVTLSMAAIHDALRDVLHGGTRFGESEMGTGIRMQVEFVSSNPTGPLTVGHGRQAVLGDVLASLYAQLGYEIEREYYFNDEGRQIDLLAESVWSRICQQRGMDVAIPEEGYHGEYLIGIARDISQSESLGDTLDASTLETLRRQAVKRMTTLIRRDLEKLGVGFDSWFSETLLHRRGDVDRALETLREHGGTYEKDGAEWLASEDHGGKKDSVLVRSDGRPTYLLVDIAYHLDKKRRGLEEVIDVQGADHQIEQDNVLTALQILGVPASFLRYAVHQFVSLRENGEALRMSTRAGRFVQLSELVDELGSDIVRYFMIARRPSTHLEFDLDLARQESLDNPVTYIQYAHTRIASIFRKAAVTSVGDPSDLDLAPLDQPIEREMIRQLDAFPNLIFQAATEFAPHLIAEYALSLSRSFHAYYADHRVLCDDPRISTARLALIEGLRLVLHRCLTILGMSTPEVM